MAALKVGAIFSPQCENNTKCGFSHRKGGLLNTSPPCAKRNLYAAGNLRLKTTRTNYKDALNLLWRTTFEDNLRAKAIRDSILIPQTWQDLRSGLQRWSTKSFRPADTRQKPWFRLRNRTRSVLAHVKFGNFLGEKHTFDFWPPLGLYIIIIIIIIIIKEWVEKPNGVERGANAGLPASQHCTGAPGPNG